MPQNGAALWIVWKRKRANFFIYTKVTTTASPGCLRMRDICAIVDKSFTSFSARCCNLCGRPCIYRNKT
jgi:hypothetical protein